MDKSFFKKSGLALGILTFFVGLLWFFKQQTALYLTLFVLIPLWAVWVWFNPYLDEKEEMPAEGGVDKEEK